MNELNCSMSLFLSYLRYVILFLSLLSHLTAP